MNTQVHRLSGRHIVRSRLADWGMPMVLLFALHFTLLRRAGAEDRIDLKTLLYSEGGDRMQIISPTFKFDKQLGIDTAIKLDGIYNSISGATPTGAPIRIDLPAAAAPVAVPVAVPVAAPVSAPPPAVTTARPAPAPVTVRPSAPSRPVNSAPPPVVVRRDDDRDEPEHEQDHEEERDDKVRPRSAKTLTGSLPAVAESRPYSAKAGATPQPQPQPQPRPRPTPPPPAPAPAPSPAPSQAPAPRPATTRRPAAEPAPAPVAQPSPPPAPVQTPQPPASAPQEPKRTGKVPTSQVEDERFGLNLDFSHRIGRHTLGMQLSYSTEQDYESMGVSVRDGIDFNQRNTTLTIGGAFTHDLITAATMDTEETKNSVDYMIGLSQTLNVRTLLTLNFSYGRVTGFLSDPYKIVELNGELVPENRPDTKDKFIGYLALTRHISLLRGSAEVSYRHYDDSFGVHADTYGLAWYQKLGPYFVVRPAVRYYRQSAADFYAYRFEGAPEFYSSDYRLSSFDSMGYGLKVIWKPFRHFATDLAVERYEQRGIDGITPGDVYPVSTLVLIGVQVPL